MIEEKSVAQHGLGDIYVERGNMERNKEFL
jgi:hypothetical protein